MIRYNTLTAKKLLNKRLWAIQNNDNWTIKQPWKFLNEKRIFRKRNSRTRYQRYMFIHANMKSWYTKVSWRKLAKLRFLKQIKLYEIKTILTWEFDPGSGWTLAACLTHASRTKQLGQKLSGGRLNWLSGGRVSNAWVTCLIQGDNS